MKAEPDEPPNANPYASPNVSSESADENAKANVKLNSNHLEEAGCFFVFALLMAASSLFSASLFYNPFAPPSGVYQNNQGLGFSIAFTVAAVTLIALGAIVLLNALRNKFSPKQ